MEVKMKKIIILGAGMVGGAIAADLSKSYSVTSADLNEARLSELKNSFNINTVKVDLSDSDQIKKLVNSFDLVIGAVPGFMGFNTLKAVLEAGKDVVDISFFGEDPFELDELAKENNVTAVVDCGVAPGCSNIILGFHSSQMKIEEFECYVGGLPFKRTLPFQYKAPFSPIDVIEEYTRPARMVENYKVVTKEALSEPELIEFDEVGTLEAFNTDGLRSLIKTINAPNMKEKTLRYPGHISQMKFLKDAGYFDAAPILIGDISIKPIELSAKILFPHWRLEENEKEFTIMRVIVKGNENGISKTFIYDLFDTFDEKTKTSSMARTTGYTCTAAANLLLNKEFTRKGICSPEYIGMENGCKEKIFSYLSEREIYFRTIIK
jgi:saccharopine dehydrogenase-like NADP-dependent oxidoreductase